MKYPHSLSSYRLFLGALFSLFALFSLPATVALADAPEFIDAQANFEQGLRGDKDASKKAYEGFSKLVKEHPDNPLYLAYMGSNETIFARDDWLPWRQIKNLDKGLDHLDKALAMLGPEHDDQYERLSVISIETRLVALTTFINVPGFANRFQDAKDLFAETIEQTVFPKAPPEVRQRVYLQGADIAAKENNTADEIKYLKKALSVRPDGFYAEQIRKRLQESEQESAHD